MLLSVFVLTVFSMKDVMCEDAKHIPAHRRYPANYLPQSPSAGTIAKASLSSFVGLSVPVSTCFPPVVTHRAAEAGAEDKTARVQIVEVGSHYAEESAEVPLTPSLVRMELKFGRFRLDDRPDLQAAFLVACRVPEQFH